MTITIRTTDPAAMADRLESAIKQEIADQYGLFMADDDRIDQADSNEIIMRNGAGDAWITQPPTSHRHAAMVAAMFLLREAAVLT